MSQRDRNNPSYKKNTLDEAEKRKLREWIAQHYEAMVAQRTHLGAAAYAASQHMGREVSASSVERQTLHGLGYEPFWPQRGAKTEQEAPADNTEVRQLRADVDSLLRAQSTLTDSVEVLGKTCAAQLGRISTLESQLDHQGKVLRNFLAYAQRTSIKPAVRGKLQSFLDELSKTEGEG